MGPLIIALMRPLPPAGPQPALGCGRARGAGLAGPPPGRGGRVARGRDHRPLPAGRRPGLVGHDLVLAVGLAPGRNLTWSLAAPWFMGVLGWGIAAGLLAFGGRMGTPGAGLAVVTLLPALAAVSGPARWRTATSTCPSPGSASPRLGC